jgi:hypothetical protein
MDWVVLQTFEVVNFRWLISSCSTEDGLVLYSLLSSYAFNIVKDMAYLEGMQKSDYSKSTRSAGQ